MLYTVLLMRFLASPGQSRMTRASVAAVFVLLSSCGGGSSDKKPEVTTTSSTVLLTKNAALNWSINTPSGLGRPGECVPTGITCRPIRS